MDTWTILLTTFAFIVVSVLYYIRYMSSKYDMFKKIGIRGPKPDRVLGNFKTMMSEGVMLTQDRWYREYKADKVFGAFETKDPVLYVTDLEIIREVLIKKFNSFINRRKVDFFNDYPMEYMVSSLQDEHWKHVRNLLTPTFSSGKLKKMVGLINYAANNMVENLQSKAEAGEQVELKPYTSGFTMDAIGATAFGMEINSQADPKNPFVTGAHKFFHPRAWLLIILFFFPFIGRFLKKLGLRMWPKHLTDFFIQITDKAVKQRRSATEKTNDFLQLMVDAEIGDEDVDSEIDHRESLRTSPAWSSKGLTVHDIRGQALVFFLAGYETTATTLSFVLYSLTVNPELCQKAVEEVDKVVGNNTDISYEQCSQLQYLEMCINESLRLYPPNIRTDRVCSEDTVIQDIPFSKGLVVVIPIAAIHHDPDFWPEPDKYDPERFSPEAKAGRDPLTFMPFGAGPRNCIGMRLALMEAKIGLARLLQKYRPMRSEKTEVPIKIKKTGVLQPENGIWIKLEPRNKN